MPEFVAENTAAATVGLCDFDEATEPKRLICQGDYEDRCSGPWTMGTA